MTDEIFNFLLVWYYCTLTIRESILISNGSRYLVGLASFGLGEPGEAHREIHPAGQLVSTVPIISAGISFLLGLPCDLSPRAKVNCLDLITATFPSLALFFFIWRWAHPVHSAVTPAFAQKSLLVAW